MAQDQAPQTDNNAMVDSAVAEGGAYEVIRKRLLEQGKTLHQQVEALNQQRLSEFGSSAMEVLARARIRTENNCIARDIVQVGEYLLFGYNVFIGLKKETKIDDVFSLYKVVDGEQGLAIESVPSDNTFLTQTGFANDFEELYRYYKHTKLIQLSVKDGKLLAGFQIGERLEDIRVFRWSVSGDGKDIQYIDNRGERDLQLPPAYDFEWQATERDDTVYGRFPHINILDTVFVETTGGDLTVKVENNTESGQGIYSEPVEDDTQSLDDADVAYAKVGSLVLLKIRPYRETDWRFFIYNTLLEDVVRVDAIGQSCVQLPEDHGLVFPGGYYLQTGDYKRFDEQSNNLSFKRMQRSPNGEDVLYIFYEPEHGVVGLFAYNLIEKTLQNPIYAHGYALAEDGTLVIFNAEAEPTRVHPMQIWQTPYQSAEFASKAPPTNSELGRIGNAELVRGIADIYSVYRLIDNQSVSLRLYEELGAAALKIFDDHYWVEGDGTKELSNTLKHIATTAELVVDEFEKVESIRRQSAKTMRQTEDDHAALVRTVRTGTWDKAEDYVNLLAQLRGQRGHMATVKELRYIDLARCQQLETELKELETSLSEKTVVFLTQEASLDPYYNKIAGLEQSLEQATTNAEIEPVIADIETTAAGLDLLSELMATLKIADATIRTRIIDTVSQVYAKLNQVKAQANNKRKNLGSAEAVAQFSAQFKLFSQSITNALGMANTPEKCDEQLARLIVQLEELESQFTDYDQFLGDIMAKREEVYESFEGHKQQLIDERQRKAQSLTDAADRMLASIEKRSLKFTEADALNTYFAADALVVKVRDLAADLRQLDAAVKADDLESRLKSIKDQALRSQRDKSDIYENDGNVIRLGPRHKFSVNTQELDLTIIPRNQQLNFHLTGTSYYEVINDDNLQSMDGYWSMALQSETKSVYRAEYLASSIIQDAREETNGLSTAIVKQALLDRDDLIQLVRDYAQPRYKEGYEKGVHDHDAALLLGKIIPALDAADLLTYDPQCRALAQIYWANITHQAGRSDTATEQAEISYNTWPERAQSAAQMHSVFASNQAIGLLSDEIAESLTQFIGQHPLPVTVLDIKRAADYLVAELGRERVEFITSKYANELFAELKRSMDDNAWRRYQSSLEKLQGWPAQRWQLSYAWLDALVTRKQLSRLKRYIPEAVALINAETRLNRRPSEFDLEITVEGLLGEHPLLENGQLLFALDAFLTKLEHHRHVVAPEYRRYLEVRQQVITQRRSALRLDEFKPRPLSSFVRNKLINDSYLPIIGDNLAKQMGTIGEDKRTDLMGLLMMISPPGYGKTTLMEYVANRLGLIFMKINCPSLGHDVLSLDPAQAPNATARQELLKLNLALEMGNNVMLYLDDIQHTHPEFLQKFISLCDGTRRIEGVWQGNTKTYDMRGRKFCVVMAGNPYTESGELFKIPDMLANRADIYNLGDILGGMDEQFALSYVENSLTSNPVLAPLALRDMADVYTFVDMAKGMNVASTNLKHPYSGAEVNEIVTVLQKMFVVQEVVLKINQQYIASAAQDDKYRTEPAFKLQGSYRNMNKMAEKISSVMNERELQQMIADHYLGEAQLLTTGAEANLLKLAELRGNISEQDNQRWQKIKADFLRDKAMGGSDTDTGTKVVAQLMDLTAGIQSLSDIAKNIGAADKSSDQGHQLEKSLAMMTEALKSHQAQVTVVNEPVPELNQVLAAFANTLECSLFPLIRSMEKKLDIDLRTHEKMADISSQLRQLQSQMSEPPSR